jgi:hypothetical protein
MAKQSKSGGSKAGYVDLEPAVTIPEEEHPDYMSGTISDDCDDFEQSGDAENLDELTPIPGGPLPPRPPIPGPVPQPIPQPLPRIPMPRPFPRPIPRPIPRFCTAVSGKYRYSPYQISPKPITIAQPVGRPVVPRRIPGPLIPVNMLYVTVRVDVDRFMPQNRISIEVTRLFPNMRSHAIAEVTSDVCLGFNNRTITADIVYRDGNAAMIPGTTVTFSARRTTGFWYGAYTLTLSGGGIAPRSYDLSFQSRYFDPVEFEVDQVSNAGAIVTAYDTASHPNRPAGLPNETLSLATVYQRAGFDVTMSPNSSTLPTSGTGANGTWSDAEMHNAMITYWSRFANRPQWALWVLYAARHDRGRSLGGIMFDDIGPNHRQGTAIFTDSFIQDAPPGDPNAGAWRNRMQFWTAVHEMGHAFNLAHSWQKAAGVAQGAPGDPWIPLANENEARSFMNYPFRVSGGESSFFSDFRFTFSDNELIFMRHAPRRFVQMGNSNWFVNHAFEAPDEMRQTGNWALAIRPNRDINSYRFLEPVTMELKLTNTSGEAMSVDDDMLTDGRHVTVFLQREGGETRQWRPLITRCHETHDNSLGPDESIYGAHMISTSTEGWLIDEPGFYKVQAAIDMGAEIVVSNVMRIYVGPPASNEESAVAPDYFTEDVGRVMAFAGAPGLSSACEVLERVTRSCADNPAARMAELALTSPLLRNFKTLNADDGREAMAIKAAAAKVGAAAKAQLSALLKDPAAAADTMGNIPYFGQLRTVAEAMEDDGDEKGAVDVMTRTIEVMKQRDILASVISNVERRLKRRQ